MSARRWLIGWILLVCSMLVIIGVLVYIVDPYMHFHKPFSTKYFYELNDERSQNDGMIKHLSYDTLVIGTSMAQNFKTTEVDQLFGGTSIKAPFAGASYKEINDNIATAIQYNKSLETVIRPLDIGMFFDSKDRMRFDLGEYPTYLYDTNPFNDIKYIYNRDVFWYIVFPMLCDKKEKTGITSFDEYSNWTNRSQHGKGGCELEFVDETAPAGGDLTTDELQIIRDNIETNVVQLAKNNPQIIFYYYFTPYSIVWWNNRIENSQFEKQLEAERNIIEMILQCPNIKLYSFDERIDIISDLNNYRDSTHYAEWVSSWILKQLHNNDYRLLDSNYKSYLENKKSMYLQFDYDLLNEQTDYEDDLLAAAILNSEITGLEPVRLLEEEYLQNNQIDNVKIQYGGEGYKFLSFEVRKKTTETIWFMELNYGENENITREYMDSEWHNVVIKIPSGNKDIVDIISDITSESILGNFEVNNFTLY